MYDGVFDGGTFVGIILQRTSGGSKTPVRSAEAIHLGNFFRRQNASAERIHRSIPLMGRGELGWEEGVGRNYQESLCGLNPSLASGHRGTKLTVYGSHPTTQAERSESFETA